MDIGPMLKSRRKAAGMTQQALADRSGVSKAMISAIESNQKCPTLKLVGQLAQGLDCSISDLLDIDTTPCFELTRHENQRVLMDPTSGIERRVVSPRLLREGVEFLEYTYPPGSSMEDFPPHRPGSTEQAYVVEGRARVRFGRVAVELSAGDSVSYRADVEHGATNLLEQGTTRILFITLHAGAEPVSP